LRFVNKIVIGNLSSSRRRGSSPHVLGLFSGFPIKLGMTIRFPCHPRPPKADKLQQIKSSLPLILSSSRMRGSSFHVLGLLLDSRFHGNDNAYAPNYKCFLSCHPRVCLPRLGKTGGDPVFLAPCHPRGSGDPVFLTLL